MRTISDSVYELLMAQGLARGTAATVGPCENKSPALSTMASSGGVMADAAGGEPHRPTTREVRVDLNSGKGRAVNAPAKFTGLRLVSSRCLDTANPTREPRAAVSKHLVLVVSN